MKSYVCKSQAYNKICQTKSFPKRVFLADSVLFLSENFLPFLLVGSRYASVLRFSAIIIYICIGKN